MLFGVDISGWQENISIARIENEGFEWCAVKATEGPTATDWIYTNPYYKTQMHGVLRSDMVPLAYHFLTSGGGTKQAEHFMRVVGDDLEHVIPVPDFEPYAGYPHLTPYNSDLYQFIARLKKEIGDKRDIWIYSSKQFWNSGGGSGKLSDYGDNLHPWEASYPIDALNMTAAAIYRRVKQYRPSGFGGVPHVAWQYTRRAKVAGWQEIDANAFYGTRKDLENMVKEEDLSDDDRRVFIGNKHGDPRKEAVFTDPATARRVYKEIRRKVRLPNDKKVRIQYVKKKEPKKPAPPRLVQPSDFAVIRGWSFRDGVWKNFRMQPSVQVLAAIVCNHAGVRKEQISTYEGRDGKHGRWGPGSAFDILWSGGFGLRPNAAQQAAKERCTAVLEKLYNDLIDYVVIDEEWNEWNEVGWQPYRLEWARSDFPPGSDKDYVVRMHICHHHISGVLGANLAQLMQAYSRYL